MKKILQIKPSKRRVAAASSVAVGAGGKSARNNQKTLHPLFTFSTEQRAASIQRRLRTVLEEASSLPSCPRYRAEVRHKNRNIYASLVPNLYLLAAGDVEHSFVVPGFEEFCAHDKHSSSKASDNRRPNTNNLETASDRTEKVSSDGCRKSSPRERERGARRERTTEGYEQPKSSRFSLETSSRQEKDSFAKPSVVSPATTVNTATTSDQRIPEISALKEIITNHQVPSMIACMTEKSPSCTPTHSVPPPLPTDLDRRVSDWVDNCVSQEVAKTAYTDVQKKHKDAYEESLLSELQRSYLKLVDSEDFSDLVVETADRPIRAHKAILFVRCMKISQSLSADSCFWHLKWCSSKAALYFLRYLYAADVSFVPGLNGQLRKDLLTLCCQYQTDELAARLIRERSPSPSQLTQKPEPQSNRTRKRSAESQTVELPLASENRLDGSLSSQKKTRMSITCETVSVTIPEDGRCSIQQSPRLPQSFPPFQQSTPFITRITDDEKRDSSARGSAGHPIELGSSSSDLFSDDEVVIEHPVPPLSPIHQTPRRREEQDFEDHVNPEAQEEEEPEEGEVTEKLEAQSFRNQRKFMQRKSMSQPVIKQRFLDDDDDGYSDNDGQAQLSPRSSRLVEGLDVTPLPRYSTMKTPEMHKHLDRYGIKTGIGKQKAVKLLKNIYQATHPTAQTAAAEPAASPTSSSGDDSEVPEEETMVHDDDEEVSDNVEEKITRYIRKTPALHDKILRFEPLEVSEFKKELHEHGIRINDKMLVNYLDFHCVNISFGTQRKRSPKKARRRKPIRKPGIATIASSQP